jgi:hypothetical protein
MFCLALIDVVEFIINGAKSSNVASGDPFWLSRGIKVVVEGCALWDFLQFASFSILNTFPLSS